MKSKLTGRWPGWLAASAMAAAVAVAGCAGTSSPAASGAGASASAPAAAAASQHVTIMGNSSLRFSPMTVHVRTGAVRITLKDMGAYPHNIVIPALGVTSKTVTGDPGRTRSPSRSRSSTRAVTRSIASTTRAPAWSGVFVVS